MISLSKGKKKVTLLETFQNDNYEKKLFRLVE